MLLLQALPPVTEIKDWLGIATNGGFAVLAWYMIVYDGPSARKECAANTLAITQAYAKEQELDRELYREEIDRVAKIYEAQLMRIGGQK